MSLLTGKVLGREVASADEIKHGYEVFELGMSGETLYHDQQRESLENPPSSLLLQNKYFERIWPQLLFR